MRLQYGFFKLTARSATYLVAREHTTRETPGGDDTQADSDLGSVPPIDTIRLYFTEIDRVDIEAELVDPLSHTEMVSQQAGFVAEQIASF